MNGPVYQMLVGILTFVGIATVGTYKKHVGIAVKQFESYES